MRICYIAPFDHDWGTEEHVARSFEMLGHEVTRVAERNFAEAMFAAAQPDLVLYTRGGAGTHQRVTDWWIDRFADDGCKTASFTLDLFRGLPRSSEVGTNPFWSTSVVFTADGDPETQAWMAERGVNHRWLPPACVSDECVKVQVGRFDDRQLPGPFPDAHIVFVGSTRGYHPEWPWRMEMLAALTKRYGRKFLPLGPQEGALYRGLQLNGLYQTPGRIVIGDSLALPGHRNYFSDRYWETIGRGGFLVAPRVPGIEDFFTDWIHLRLYEPGDIDSLFALIDLYLDAPEAARAMANAGQAHVAKNHTYRNRVEQMLSELGLS